MRFTVVLYYLKFIGTLHETVGPCDPPETAIFRGKNTTTYNTLGEHVLYYRIYKLQPSL